MRTLKFRAWHNEEGYMVESDRGVYTALQHVLGVTVGSGFSNCDMSAKPLRYTVMQFIGMSDRNGKEIYEGDILTSVHSKYTYKVEWQERFASFGIRILEHELRNTVNQITNPLALEVVGNIFQNPELIPAQKQEKSIADWAKNYNPPKDKNGWL